MGVEAKQECSIKKTMRCCLRRSWRCASEHWALFSLALLFYLLYRCSPGFFAFLLSTSPVIICTTLLLGVLLSCRSAHLPEIDEDRTAPSDISAPKFGTSSRNVHVKAHKRFLEPAIKENIIRKANFGRANSSKRIDLDERVNAAGGRLEKMLTSVPSMEECMNTYAEKESKNAFSSIDKGDEYANLLEDVHESRVDEKKNVREDIATMAKPNHQGGVFTESQSGEVADVSEHKSVDGAAGKCRWARAFSVRQRKKLADIKIEGSNSVGDNQLEYSQCSFNRVDSHDCSSGFDLDNAERHSPDVSMTDTVAVLDETEPLLGADFSCSGHMNNDGSDVHSNISAQDSQADSDNNNVGDNSKAKNDGEEKKDVENEPAFLWTADDEKNVMDLGYSEMERNRRLEMLMVKRKSRKNIKFELDGMGRIADDLSCFRPQVQPISISAPRMNPFADEAEMPGSAPPILHQRKSPFDFLTEQSNDSGGPSSHSLDSHESMPVSHQDMPFKRHESFNFGRPQRHAPRFKPCFVLEEFGFDEASASSFQRQFSDRSVSRLSVVSECDTVSSVGDQEHNELIRNYIREVRESPSLLRQDSDVVYTGTECADGISFADNETLNAIIC